MDGNRRYARQLGIAVGQGHGEGFESLKRTLEICLQLGIGTVTVYAFSIENFSRPQHEVDTIMDLAKSNLRRLCEEGELLDTYDVRVNVLGRRELLPEDVRGAIEEVEELTKGHESSILNVCCPYTAQDEVTTAIERTISDSELNIHSSMTVSDIESRLFTSQDSSSPPLDILVRTSDVRRLSDFLLWQASSNTQLQFVKTFWPQFGIKDMLPILLQYQQKIYLNKLR